MATAVLCAVVSALSAAAQSTVVLVDTSNVVSLGTDRVYFYGDEDRSASLSHVRRNPALFARTSGQRLCFGFKDHPYWLRFISAEVSEDRDLLLEIADKSLDSISVYARTKSGTYEPLQMGDHLPFNTRPVKHRNFVFEFEHNDRLPDTTFIRVVTSGPMCIPMTIYSHVGFHKVERRRQFVLGGFFGLLVVMLLFNLLIWLAIRDTAYGVYILYIGTFLLYQIAVERIGFEYLWSEAIWWEQRSYGVFGLVTTLFGIQFARVFLRTKNLVTVLLGSLDRYLVGAMWASAPLLFMQLFADRQSANISTVIYLLFTCVLLTFTAIASTVKGRWGAKWYLVAWSFLFVATMISMLGYLGILPLGNLRVRVVQLGSSLQLTLLALALGFRLKEEHDAHVRERRARFAARHEADGKVFLVSAILHGTTAKYINAIEKFILRLSRNANARPGDKEIRSVSRSLTRLHGAVRETSAAANSKQRSLFTLSQDIKDLLVDRFEGSDIGLQYRWHPNPALSKDKMLPGLISISTAHIIGEIANNVIKHAGRAGSVSLDLELTDRMLKFRMWDDGDGMKGPGKGRGLRDIRRFANEFNGTAELGPGPNGRGVLWDVQLPLTDENMEDPTT